MEISDVAFDFFFLCTKDTHEPRDDRRIGDKMGTMSLTDKIELMTSR